MSLLVYGLYSTRDKEIRYVGETNRLDYRLAAHISNAQTGRDNSKKAVWIRQEIVDGYKIEAIILCKNSRRFREEQRFIDAFSLSLGPLLLNTVGAQGASDLIKEGLERARAQGKQIGRTPLAPEKIQAISESLLNGVSINKTAKALKVGIATVHRVKTKLVEEGLLNLG